MTVALEALIREASQELGSEPCRAGAHDWISEGGRACPKELTDNCSQAVYVCRTCGQYDYGAKGGPGEDDCNNHCRHRGESRYN